MKYKYGTNDSYSNSCGRTATAKQIASIIKRDVEYGKWNKYDGGKQDNYIASCEYSRKGFIHHERLYIYGKRAEFDELEKLIHDVDNLKVIPRKYDNY